MKAPLESPTDEVTRLRGCLNDLAGIMALPALWAGGEPAQIVSPLLDALIRTLRLAFVFIRLNDSEGGRSIELARIANSFEGTARAQEIRDAIDSSLGDAPLKWPPRARVVIGNVDLVVASARLGLQGEIGVVVAGSRNLDFPAQTERLLLDVAVNQAALGLQRARLVSEQRRVATLRESERNSRLIVDSIPGQVALLTADLRRNEAFLAEGQLLSRVGSFSWRVATDEIMWSEQLYRIFEIDRDVRVTFDVIGSRIHPEDLSAFTRQIERSRRDGSDVQLEFRLQMPDHSVKYVHVVAHSLDERGQLEYIGAVQDVTQRRLSEEALASVRSELAYVSRVTTLGVLTASIAHEVNQPLSGIITNASTCVRMLAADPPDINGARETARRTIRDGNRASDVMARLRGLFSKTEFTLEPLDLNEAAREVIALSSDDLRRHRIILQSELADDLPIVTGDRIQLQQVILNLLRNASDAMVDVHDRPRQLLIKTEREDGDGVRFTVRDVGMGLPPQSLDSLFHAFHTTKSGGMGIGLFVSRSIVERHHGRLWAEPNDGPGATFSFSIPFQTA